MTDDTQIRISFEESLMMAAVSFLHATRDKGSFSITLQAAGDGYNEVILSRYRIKGGYRYRVMIDVDDDTCFTLIQFIVQDGLMEFSGVRRGTPYFTLERVSLFSPGRSLDILTSVVALLESNGAGTMGEQLLGEDSLNVWAAIMSSNRGED